MTLLAGAAGVLACVGAAQSVAGLWAVRGFRAETGAGSTRPAGERPPITILKPLHGDEALLESALASLCAQDYPAFQIVFGLHDEADPALAVVRRVQARFPDCDIAVVIDRARHGRNGKVSNLINMLPAARHDLLVIADSDVHAPPGYLDALAAALAMPGTGLVTTLYAGLAASATLAGRLGASGITHGFLAGALLGRKMGRQDCLGATMALHRTTLAAIGGLPALANHLADDNVLGQLVRGQGLAVRLAATVPATTVAETTLGALFRHELRWARTIRALVPGAFALSSLQYPLAWAAIAVALAVGAAWSIWLFGMVWLVRALVAAGVDAALPSTTQATPAAAWLLPLRDLFSLLVLLASYGGDRVEWRGQVMTATPR